MSRLTPGMPAPAFDRNDYLGNRVAFPAEEGMPVFLSFYRYATCPMCNLRTREIVLAQDRFDAASIHPIAVWQSPEREIAEQMAAHEPPFPVIADPKFALYRKYGVEQSWLGLLRSMGRIVEILGAFRMGFTPGKVNGPMNRIPADFLIGADGRIVDAYYGNDAGDHMPLERLFAHF